MTNELMGLKAHFSKTVTETDVVMFSGITGDLDPLHLDEEYAKKTVYGRRLVHGALITSFMMTAASIAAQGAPQFVLPSVGLDRLRHTGPVFIGDTMNVNYVVTASDPSRSRYMADVTVKNQRGETVGIATHIFKAISL
ncbi:dehydratase [Hypericibacter adhaerens]|uniref:Dehydratase n=1 Tax=Hypericibacter adhaerens TaxID=2602016 RepID=A0A5J6MR95_9PROT|nr:MaoC/PaaZ C-terminal domain-containing protein [Hypericibacter adhaerens]QEX20202.1 dehydratase [Hypericibacter adhaerens]